MNNVELIFDSVYGCKYCEYRDDECVNGSLYEPRLSMSKHPTCESFSYKENKECLK